MPVNCVPTTGAPAFALTADAFGGVLAVNAAMMVIGPVTLVLIAGSEYPGVDDAGSVNEPPSAETVHATLAAFPSAAVTSGDADETTLTGPEPSSMVAAPVVPFVTTLRFTMIPDCPDAALRTAVPANVPFDGVISK